MLFYRIMSREPPICLTFSKHRVQRPVQGALKETAMPNPMLLDCLGSRSWKAFWGQGSPLSVGSDQSVALVCSSFFQQHRNYEHGQCFQRRFFDSTILTRPGCARCTVQLRVSPFLTLLFFKARLLCHRIMGSIKIIKISIKDNDLHSFANLQGGGEPRKGSGLVQFGSGRILVRAWKAQGSAMKAFRVSKSSSPQGRVGAVLVLKELSSL